MAPAAAAELSPEEAIAAARQDYLDALPIAAAILHEATSGRCVVEHANVRFAGLSGHHLPVGEGDKDAPFLADSGIGAAALAFLHGNEPWVEFDGHDGHRVGGRHFAVRLARLKPTNRAARRCLLSLIDRTAQVETERSLRTEMLRDSLTGLANRLGFNERIEALLADPDLRPGSYGVLVLDLTRFSRVNECVGSLAGDELLITVARRMLSALRAGDLLARTGGDEFGLLVKLDDGASDAIEVAERIRSVLATPFRLSELEIRVDCAIGCALLTGREILSEEVLRNAQFALKRAKLSGDIQVYKANEARAARRRFSIETELRRAIEADELSLAFQPLVHLATGRVAGFEALARWDHDERGAISPTEFIPVAEESGLIVGLGRWAIEAATRTLAGWDEAAGRPLPLSVSVNLSAAQLGRDDVAAAVASALTRNRLAGERLTIELTESAIVHDPVRAQQVLEALKGLGAKVAMDDFGTGYTSLAYLQRLPIDVLKIDRSFVAGMIADSDSIAIVRAVLSLADALGMETTAEGIESEALAQIVRAMGCTYGQGFHFAAPLDAEAALAYSRSRSA